MLISDIGEIVSAYQQITRLDQLIDAAKSGKITVQVNGAGQGEEIADAVQKEVVMFLRSQRGDIVRSLAKWGFEE
jgi:phosphoribosylcarboxyaminoimidazole (NCAIR) mutase